MSRARDRWYGPGSRRARWPLAAILPGLFLWSATLLVAVPVRGEDGAEPHPAPATEAAEEDEAHPEDTHAKEGHHSSRLSDHALPLQLEGFPQRPRPPLELGEPFLGTGTLHPGFRLPTGAVWQPSLFAFGSWRTAVQSFDSDAGPRRTELRTRLDLFLNLQLSGSERLVAAFRPLDQDGRFTRYVFEGPVGEGEGFDELDLELEALFFEGDFGEIFPNLSRDDFRRTDIGFSVGRQSLVFQEGQLIGDTLDAVGLTRNTLLPSGTSNFRATLLVGWDEVHRGGLEESDASLFGLLTSTDVRRSTIDADVVYVASDGVLGDQVAAGVSAVQRFGLVNTTFRALASFGLDDTAGALADGGLFFSEVAWTPHGGHDLVYVTSFVAIDQYVPAARDPATGGPLANAGIGFAGSGLGFPGPLSSVAADVAGGAIGFQKFGAHTRRQTIYELGARIALEDTVADEVAATIRWQTAFGRHYVLLVDGFGGWREGLAGGDDATLLGARLELLTKF